MSEVRPMEARAPFQGFRCAQESSQRRDSAAAAKKLLGIDLNDLAELSRVRLALFLPLRAYFLV